MFCVECGKEKEIYKNGVCIDCFIKNNSFTEGPLEIDLPYCSHCNSYKYKNTWTSELLNDVLTRIVKSNFKIHPGLKKIDINPVCEDTEPNMECKIFISGYIEKHEITEENNLLVHLKKTVCDVCSKQYGGYHEAILQIRAQDRNLSKKEIKNITLTVENLVETMISKGNRGLFITDFAEEHGGIDFYLSDKNAALVIIKKIQENFGGHIKQSSKNTGMKDGKQIYRMTYLLRLPQIKKNDFIKYDNKFFYVKNIKTNTAKLISLSTWKETTYDLKKLEKVKVIGNKELIKDMILVSQNKDEVQVMNDKNYKLTVIKKPEQINLDSEKIKTIKINDKLFLFPIQTNSIHK